jgi:hypothetical protein
VLLPVSFLCGVKSIVLLVLAANSLFFDRYRTGFGAILQSIDASKKQAFPDKFLTSNWLALASFFDR